MARILVGVTGSVAAIRTPQLYEALRSAGHEVKIVATKAALHFFDAARINPVDPAFSVRNPESCLIDDDEWPSEGYQRGDPVLHIELRRWAEVLLIAPLDANTLAKLAVGLSDNCLTCVWRAWDWSRPVVLAPAMNTLMWKHPFTRRHLRSLAADFGAAHIPGHLDEMQVVTMLNDRAKGLRVVPPISKELACGDVGDGAMAEVQTIVETVNQLTVDS